jgi:hypothetical protein
MVDYNETKGAIIGFREVPCRAAHPQEGSRANGIGAHRGPYTLPSSAGKGLGLGQPGQPSGVTIVRFPCQCGGNALHWTSLARVSEQANPV